MATSDFDIATIIDRTPLFVEQWHLNNTGQTGGTPGADANILDAWSIATGEGVVIGIVDEGLDYTHPDLNDNYNSALSYEFVNSYPNKEHGTLVAGIAVGEGDNTIGIIGAAPDANFASLSWDTSTFYNALSYKNQDIDIYNNSWTLEANFVRLPQQDQNALENGIQAGRGGLGNIYVFAAGNDGLKDNVNYDPFTNSRYTITVGSIDHNGKHPEYSTPGSSLLISGYTDSDYLGVITTDIINDYAYVNGTSAAAPLVSGVIALMLEANPSLTWRDVQHILVETAELNDPDDADWSKNGAGHDVNYKYGFGGIDATAAVNAAVNWSTVAEEISFTSEIINVNSIIPDNNTFGISSSLTIAEDIDIEWVEIVFDAEHSWRGDLEIVLTSPDGTESILAEQRNDDGFDYNNWVFTSARHWGESSEGEWKLTVSDRDSLIDGTWNSWQINLYGTESISLRESDFLQNPVPHMKNIVDFDGQDLGSSDAWKQIGSIDAQGDEDIEHIFVNSEIGRWATVGADITGVIDFDNHGWGGDTRVVGIYEDPLIKLGIVEKGSDFDSQKRFQQDLYNDNLILIPDSGFDYDNDGLQNFYFKLSDETAVLHALMHADGNIQYANYQSEADLEHFMTENNIDSSIWTDWF